MPSPQKGEDVIVKILNLNDVEIKTQDGQVFTIDNFDYEDEEGPYPFLAARDVQRANDISTVGALQIFTSETDKDYDQRTGEHEFNTMAVPQG